MAAQTSAFLASLLAVVEEALGLQLVAGETARRLDL
jgi:hypothetical protein